MKSHCAYSGSCARADSVGLQVGERISPHELPVHATVGDCTVSVVTAGHQLGCINARWLHLWAVSQMLMTACTYWTNVSDGSVSLQDQDCSLKSGNSAGGATSVKTLPSEEIGRIDRVGLILHRSGG